MANDNDNEITSANGGNDPIPKDSDISTSTPEATAPEIVELGHDSTGTTAITPAEKRISSLESKSLEAAASEKAIQPIIDSDNLVEAESQEKKIPYPKSIFFIISNEFCERFNYYGMRTILVLYLSYQLNYSHDTSTIIFHIFTMFVYFLCIFGAIISDSWLGKFKTIFYLSLVYVCGSIMVTLGAIPTLNLPGRTFTMIGLSLIALGSGGIKPCVSAFGGDQFTLPQQTAQMVTYFSVFYFAINSGSLVSTTITPILREDVHCFGEMECYSLAFGVPAVLMVVSIIIFILGRPLYNSKPPAGNMVVLVSKTIGNAIATKWKEKKTNPREHWLDYADKKYEKSLIEDVKVLMRVLVLFLPLPVFWALFDQQGSRWTFQATRMDGDMGSWNIKPDQLQVLNPLLILAFIPLYDIAFYPALSWIGIRRPLQKLTLGGVLAGVAFIISALVELKLETTYPVLPSVSNAQFRVFNGEPCAYHFATNISGMESFDVEPLDYFVYKDIRFNGDNSGMQYTITPVASDCPPFKNPTGVQLFNQSTAYSLFMNTHNGDKELNWYKDFADKPTRGNPMVRTLSNVKPGRSIKWKTVSSGSVHQNQPSPFMNLTELSFGEYQILVDDHEVMRHKLRTGGVYTLVINEESDTKFNAEIFEVTTPNSVNILLLIPQYVVLTLGEVMFSVTGLEFSYSQAPLSMKSVLSACWLLTVAFGNVIVVIIAELSLFESQANEFFLFAGIMFVDMIIFMFIARAYTPNNPIKEEEPLLKDSTDPKHEIRSLEGIDNKTLDLQE